MKSRVASSFSHLSFTALAGIGVVMPADEEYEGDEREPWGIHTGGC